MTTRRIDPDHLSSEWRGKITGRRRRITGGIIAKITLYY